jgi:type II restriction/modification system DNA methylase subunit YeeA
MLSVMGDDYTSRLRRSFFGDVEPFADLVCYWFELARQQIETGKLKSAGLVATNSIRGGASRETLKSIVESTSIFDAWSDEPWVIDGAAVRVSIACFGVSATPPRLNGVHVDRINPDLTGSQFDLSSAAQLCQNLNVCFEGGQKHGRFELTGEEARTLLGQPLNPNGRANSDVLRLLLNATDMVRRPSDTWVVLFPDELSEASAALYEEPFRVVEERVKPGRLASKLATHRQFWWRHHRTRPALRAAIGKLARYIVTPVVAKYRLFIWMDPSAWPSNLLDAIARDDGTTFGILHSRFHELWSLRMGTWLGVGNDPRYTPSTTFETFPFPEGLTPDIPAADYAGDPRAQAIAAAAADLNAKREAWLNPDDLVVRVPEVVAGYPDRVLPRDDKAAEVLKKRTLTNLYNQRPAWLDHAHAKLDAAVAEAYGWGEDWRAGRLGEEEILARLFALNQARAG